MADEHFYDALYYQVGLGMPYERNEVWMNIFQNLADRIITEINPTTVLDAGCAFGFLVEALRKRGVEAYGVDLSTYAISQVQEEIKPYCWAGSISEPFPQRYDLIVTIEVLEHLPKDQIQAAIHNLSQYSDDILFSSTPEDFRELTHISVQQPEAWAEAFAREGFYRDLDFDAFFLTAWAARFRRSNAPVHQRVKAYERKLFELNRDNFAMRQIALEQRELTQRVLDSQAELDRTRHELDTIRLSSAYKISTRLERLLPRGGWLRRMLSGLKRKTG